MMPEPRRPEVAQLLEELTNTVRDGRSGEESRHRILVIVEELDRDVYSLWQDAMGEDLL